MNKDEAIELAKKVDGWMDPPDLDFLYNVASFVKEGDKIVEVGPWRGRSTTALVLGAKTKDITVVDKWEGTIGEEEYFPTTGIPIREEFIANMKKTGLVPAMIYEESWKGSERFADGSITLLFIDANHTEDFVYRDIISWLPKVRKGGIICGHDWYSKPGVPIAVRKVLAEHSELANLKLVGCNIWAMEKQ
jgi:predicted O-methyltransferase YrrM